MQFNTYFDHQIFFNENQQFTVKHITKVLILVVWLPIMTKN